MNHLSRIVRTLGLAAVILLALLGLAFVQFQAGTSSNDLVTQTLNAQGFQDFAVNWTPAGLVCQSGEQGYAFNAVNREGAPVQGIVCVRNSVAARHAYIVYR